MCAASDRVLENLSKSLQLSPEERDYLFLLAQRPSPRRSGSCRNNWCRTPSSARWTRLNVPAEVITPRWDVRLLERDGQALLPRLRRAAAGAPQPDAHPDHQSRISGGPRGIRGAARRITAKLKIDYSQADGDPAFDALIEEMSEASPVFRELWRCSEVRGRSEGVHLLRHPQLGGITFEHTSYVVEGAPSLRVVIFAPHDAEERPQARPARAAGEPGSCRDRRRAPAGRGRPALEGLVMSARDIEDEVRSVERRSPMWRRALS